jgi:hypothetical protein
MSRRPRAVTTSKSFRPSLPNIEAVLTQLVSFTASRALALIAGVGDRAAYRFFVLLKA